MGVDFGNAPNKWNSTLAEDAGIREVTTLPAGAPFAEGGDDGCAVGEARNTVGGVLLAVRLPAAEHHAEECYGQHLPRNR